MKPRRLFVALAGLALGAGGCSNGAFEVAAPAAATPSPAAAATTPAPSPSVTSTPQGATPTPAPSGPTPTPAPSSSATAAPNCASVGAGPFQESWTLNGSALTVTLPPYYSWQGTLAIPAQSPSGTVIEEADDQDNYFNAPTSTSGDPAYAARTRDFYMTFRLSQSTNFSTALLPVQLVSSCLTNGTTYHIDTFLSGAFLYTESAAASGGSVTLNIKMTPNPFPGNAYMIAVVSH